jgi:hypothetical protein
MSQVILPPDEFGAVFLAQVITLAILQVWRAGRQASQEELGNRPRPSHDGIHLVLTGFGIVLGLVLLIIFVSRPVIFPNFGGSSSVIVPLIAFSIFVCIIFVIGIRSGPHASGVTSNPWISSFSLVAAAALPLAAMVLPWFFLPHTRIPQPYQKWVALLIGVAVVVIWQFVIHHLQHNSAQYPSSGKQ